MAKLLLKLFDHRLQELSPRNTPEEKRIMHLVKAIISDHRLMLLLFKVIEFITICVMLCLARKEAQAMLRYRDLPTHTNEVLDLTSLTVDELTALVPAFEAAFLGDLGDWTLHGRRRQARRYTTSKNCPLPTPEERLLFILVYLKQHPTPLLHGRLFGMRQSKATPWIHVL